MEYDDTVYGLLSASDLYKLYSLYYKIISLIDENRGELYFNNEHTYRYYHTLLKEAHKEADEILSFMREILEYWLVDHLVYNLFTDMKLYKTSNLYKFLKEKVGISKDELLSFMAEQAPHLKYDSDIEYWDDVPKNEDIDDYLLEENILNGEWDVETNKFDTTFHLVDYSSQLGDLPKMLPEESSLLFKRYMPQILEWIKNDMGGDWAAIQDALNEIKEVLQNKDNIDITQKIAIIDRVKDIQHSMGGVFGVSADLEQDVLRNFVEEIPEKLREDYYPYEIQNEFFEYLTHGDFEEGWNQEMEKRAQQEVGADFFKEGIYPYQKVASDEALQYVIDYFSDEYNRFKLGSDVDVDYVLKRVLNFPVQIIDSMGSPRARKSKKFIVLYIPLSSYNVTADKYNPKYKDYVQSVILHELMHYIRSISNPGYLPPYWVDTKEKELQKKIFEGYDGDQKNTIVPPDYEGSGFELDLDKYYSDQEEMRADMFAIEFLLNKLGWSREEVIKEFTTFRGFSRADKEVFLHRMIDILESPTPQEYTKNVGQGQLFANARNWYKIASVRNYVIVNKQDIEKLYELEFKLHQLTQKEYLSDTEYVYYSKLYEKADVLTDKLVDLFFRGVDFWLKFHNEDPKNKHDYRIGSDVVDNMYKAWGYLRKTSTEDAQLNDKFMALFYTINLIHHNGLRVVGISDREDAPEKISDTPSGLLEEYDKLENLGDTFSFEEEEFLDRLSEDTELVEQWEQEIERRAGSLNWYKVAQEVELPAVRVGPRGSIPIHAIKRLKDTIREEFGLKGVPLEISKMDIERGLLDFVEENYAELSQLSQVNPMVAGQAISNMDESILANISQYTTTQQGISNQISEEDQKFLSGLDLSNEFNRNFYNWVVKEYMSSFDYDLSDIHLWLFENDMDPTTHSLQDILYMMKSDYNENTDYPPLPSGPLPNQSFEINNNVIHVINLREKEALVKEGDVMNNCIGTYYEQAMDEVKRGVSVISSLYSLRDANNNPHVDIELRGKYVIQAVGKNNQEPKEPYKTYLNYWLEQNNLEQMDVEKLKNTLNTAIDYSNGEDDIYHDALDTIDNYVEDAIESGDGRIMANVAVVLCSYSHQNIFKEVFSNVLEKLENNIIETNNARAMFEFLQRCGLHADFNKIQQAIIQSGDALVSAEFLNEYRGRARLSEAGDMTFVYRDPINYSKIGPIHTQALMNNVLKNGAAINKLNLSIFYAEELTNQQVDMLLQYLLRKPGNSDDEWLPTSARKLYAFAAQFHEVLDVGQLRQIYSAIRMSDSWDKEKWIDSFYDRFF